MNLLLSKRTKRRCVFVAGLATALALSLFGFSQITSADPPGWWAQNIGFFSDAGGNTWCGAGGGGCSAVDQNDVIPQSASCYEGPATYDGKFYVGDYALCPSNLSDFINEMKADSNSGNNRSHTGAAMIFWTLLGDDRTYANNHGGRDVSNATIPGVGGTGWDAMQTYMQDELNNGQITINWNTDTSTPDSFYELWDGGKGDVAWYKNTVASQPAIVIKDSTGKVIYILYRFCANPGGDLQGLPTLQNPAPTGHIVADDCSEVGISLNYPSDPSKSVDYYLSADGGTHKYKNPPNGKPYPGNTAADRTINVSQEAGFNDWSTNDITLWAVDLNGNQVKIGDVTLGQCGEVSCKDAWNTLQAGVLDAGEPETFKVWDEASTKGPLPGGLSHPNVKFTSIKIDTLNASPNYVNPGTTTPPYDLDSPAETFTPQAATTYTLTWTMDGSDIPAPQTCSTSAQFAYQPFFTVAGGDIAAGPGFGQGCTSGTATNIEGENTDTLAGNSYYGAGSQLGALATGNIVLFDTDTTNIYNGSSTSQASDGSPGGRPSGLAFGNTSASGTDYGGKYNRASWCTPDYEGSAPAPTSATVITSANANTLSSLTAGTYVYDVARGTVLPALTLKNGVHLTLLLSTTSGGSVYLSGPITYNSYTGLANIPSFQLLVSGGDIYIDANVNTLDGFYDAQPYTGNKWGVIYTCSQNNAGIFTGLNGTDDANAYNDCNHQLAVYGSVAAYQVELGRTAGNLIKTSVVSDNPAEQFIYSPELWLANLGTPNNTCSTDLALPGCTYQSYTSLPPVL